MAVIRGELTNEGLTRTSVKYDSITVSHAGVEFYKGNVLVGTFKHSSTVALTFAIEGRLYDEDYPSAGSGT